MSGRRPTDDGAETAPPPRDDAVTAITDAHRQRWRATLARQGMAVNERLTTLLASKNAKLLDIKLPHEQKPGERPEERLRRWLDQISDAQRRLAGGAFGACLGCGAALPVAVLDEAPWTERCGACGDL